MRLSYAVRDRIAENVIENEGGEAAIETAMDSGEFDVSTLKRLIREAIWIAGMEE